MSDCCLKKNNADCGGECACSSGEKDCACSGGACGNSSGCGMSGGCAAHGSHTGKHFIMILVGIFLVLFLGTLVVNNIKKYSFIGRAAAVPRSITVNGNGKVTATPTIAVTNVGLVTEKPDVASAQTENTQKMNTLVAAMQQLGIPKEDIQTAQYQIYPKYSYDEKKGSTIIGYSVTQGIEIKIRDLTKISQVLAKAGEAGANQVSGIQFTIDDPKVLRAQAREEALKDVKAKAQKLATELGVELSAVISYSEYQPSDAQPPRLMYAKEAAVGAEAPAPDIQAGSLDISSEVSITYEIK